MTRQSSPSGVDCSSGAYPSSAESAKRRIHLAAKKMVVVAVLLGVLVAGAMLAADKKFDRKCEAVAVWVKNNHPTPGAYPDLALPASSKSLTADHVVDAVMLPDGRVVLVLKTSVQWRHN